MILSVLVYLYSNQIRPSRFVIRLWIPHRMAHCCWAVRLRFSLMSYSDNFQICIIALKLVEISATIRVRIKSLHLVFEIQCVNWCMLVIFAGLTHIRGVFCVKERRERHLVSLTYRLKRSTGTWTKNYDYLCWSVHENSENLLAHCIAEHQTMVYSIKFDFCVLVPVGRHFSPHTILYQRSTVTYSDFMWQVPGC